MNGSRGIQDRFLDEVKSAPDVNAGLSRGEGSFEGLRASFPIGGTYKGRSRDVKAPERRKEKGSDGLGSTQLDWGGRSAVKLQDGQIGMMRDSCLVGWFVWGG